MERALALRWIVAALAASSLLAPAGAVGGAPTSLRKGDWPMFRFDPAHSGLNPDERTINRNNVGTLVEKWRGVLHVPSRYYVNTSPAVAGNTVFIGAKSRFYAFSANGCGGTTCEAVWSGETGGAISSSPAVHGDVVYVGAKDHLLYAFPAAGCGQATCTPLWTDVVDQEIGFSSPTVADGSVYVGTSSRGAGSEPSRLYAFPAAGCGQPACYPSWRSQPVLGHNQIDSSPAVADGMVFFYGDDGYLRAYAAGGCGRLTCDPLWSGKTDTGYPVSASSPTVANGFVYVGGGECFVHHCNDYVFAEAGCGSDTCEPVWKAGTGGGDDSSPAVAYGFLYQTSVHLYAFDAAGCGQARCQPLWRGHIGRVYSISSPAVANGLVFVRGGKPQAGKLMAFDAAGSGRLECPPLWTAPAGDDSPSSPAISNGMVFVAGNDRLLHAFGLP